MEGKSVMFLCDLNKTRCRYVSRSLYKVSFASYHLPILAYDVEKSFNSRFHYICDDEFLELLKNKFNLVAFSYNENSKSKLFFVDSLPDDILSLIMLYNGDMETIFSIYFDLKDLNKLVKETPHEIF